LHVHVATVSQVQTVLQLQTVSHVQTVVLPDDVPQLLLVSVFRGETAVSVKVARSAPLVAFQTFTVLS
jgi:hypothetical protein